MLKPETGVDQICLKLGKRQGVEAKWVVSDESRTLRLALQFASCCLLISDVAVTYMHHHIQDKFPSPYSVSQASLKFTILQPQSPLSEVRLMFCNM